MNLRRTPAVSGLRTITVSLVEDRTVVRESLRALIGGTDGFACLGAYGSMEDALPGLEANLPDVVVIDLGLPGMSGIDGIRLLRERYPRLAMIVLTVFDDDQRIFEAICAGAEGYLLKNSPPSAILDGIREIVDGGAPMSPAIARRVMELFRRFQPPETAAHNLTPHELRVLKMMAEGDNLKTAAKKLGVTANTVAYHMKRIYEKLQVHSKAEAVAKALRQGLLR
ncbi:MAG: response regulator transcription factor [Acidobacteria bacterium]|nr:response regulator transcription factor [Acidobacteriota bacterium]